MEFFVCTSMYVCMYVCIYVCMYVRGGQPLQCDHEDVLRFNRKLYSCILSKINKDLLNRNLSTLI
jgi:hypothetical protein